MFESLQDIAKNMADFERASAQLNMSEEVVNDTLDDIMNESGDEEEGDAIVNQVRRDEEEGNAIINQVRRGRLLSTRSEMNFRKFKKKIFKFFFS